MAGMLKVGDPYEPGTVLGPVITAAHRDRVEGYIAAGRDEGAEIVAGGQRPEKPDKGYYVAPTLLAGCRLDMKVVQEEIFGPVIVALPFDDEDEGIAIANGTDFGLYDYVFSADTNQAFRRASGCAPATSASTRRSATTTPRSAGRSSAGSAATAGSSACTRTASSSRSSGPADGGVEPGDGLRRPRRRSRVRHAAPGAGAVGARRRCRGSRTPRSPTWCASRKAATTRGSSTSRCATTWRSRASPRR